jgi:hypothetical protein
MFAKTPRGVDEIQQRTLRLGLLQVLLLLVEGQRTVAELHKLAGSADLHSHLFLVRKILDSISAAKLRKHYPACEGAIGTPWMGSKRLDELREKLFEVL